MTGREQPFVVLNGRMPDRAQITLFLLDQGPFLNQLSPSVDPWDFETLHLKVIEAQRQFGVDVFVRLLFGLNDPLSIHMGGLNISQQTDNWEVATEELTEGNTVVYRSTIRKPWVDPHGNSCVCHLVQANACRHSWTATTRDC